MSQPEDKIETEQEHELAIEPEEQAHLEDVVPEAVETADGTNDSLDQQLVKAQATIKEYWDQILRMRAEIENNRKRSERDVENAHKYALKSFVENLLPVIDSMEMGQTAATSENATLESICEGSELTMNMFVQVLERSGLQQIDPLGEKFDPQRHQAISMVEIEDAESNSIIEVMQKGFLLNDRLIRPAMVVVAK
ncbi:nucleotide exchange factor GrpE [Gammaproteobacteria bacterium]|nr:nucleotide exchange factor GrpE [Gammaproteobacteria bacterium]